MKKFWNKKRIRSFLIQVVVASIGFVLLMWAIYGDQELDKYLGMGFMELFGKFFLGNLLAYFFIYLEEKYGKKEKHTTTNQ